MPTYHVQKSRKTNNAKSRKWPKTSHWAIFLTISRPNISKLQIFQVSFELNVKFSTNFRSKTKKIVRAVFEKNCKVSDFGLIWRPFLEYLQIKNFFKNPAPSLFYLYSPLTSCKKSEKSFKPFLRKLRYQPTNYYQQHRCYRSSLTPVKWNKRQFKQKQINR